jgi:hypothetical protein
VATARNTTAAVLTALLTLAAAFGLVRRIPPGAGVLVWIISLAAAGALHVAWISLLTTGRSRFAAALFWFACARLAASGLHSNGATVPAWFAEVLLLCLVLAHNPRPCWADRFAAWRQARAAIATQLQMGEGLLPWLLRCVEQVWKGSPLTPIQSAHLLVQSALLQSARSLECRLLQDVEHEHFCQLALTALTDVANHAAVTFAKASIDIEQQAFAAASQLRDAAQSLPVEESERTRLAGWCEELLFSLTLPDARRFSSQRKGPVIDDEK